MKPTLKNAWGYQGGAMNLPVARLDEAVPFYENVLGFRVNSQSGEPHTSTVLERDGIQIGLAENGGDPSQDGCAFEVDDVAELHTEISADLNAYAAALPNDGIGTAPKRGGSVSPEVTTEVRKDGTSWRVFFVVAPDGLCYWFGEKR